MLNLSICEAVTDTGVEFVKCLPFKLLEREEASGLNGAFQGRGPDCEFAAVANGFCDKTGKRVRIGFAALRKVCVSSNLTRKVVLRLAVLEAVSIALVHLEVEQTHT